MIQMKTGNYIIKFSKLAEKDKIKLKKFRIRKECKNNFKFNDGRAILLPTKF